MSVLDLNELREAWKIAVCTQGGVALGLGAHEPDYPTRRSAPCWFGENVPGVDACEHGPRGIEGAHWIKRQRVEKLLGFLLPIGGKFETPVSPAGFDRAETVALAAWDPRNGVPACHRHHARFDSQRMPPLVIWRHEVPAHVEAFALDWGLEGALEDRNPTLDTGGI